MSEGPSLRLRLGGKIHSNIPRMAKVPFSVGKELLYVILMSEGINDLKNLYF
jgi:hypothetical protein